MLLEIIERERERKRERDRQTEKDRIERELINKLALVV